MASSISLAANGELKIERGYVRPEDEPVVEEDAAAGDVSQDGEGDDAVVATGGVSFNGKPVVIEEPDEDDGKIRPLSERLIEDLTAARASGMRSPMSRWWPSSPCCTFSC